MPWVTVPIDGWKDHPDSPHLDGKPKIGDSSAHATSGVVSPNEPDTFLGGVLKSILSGDALSAGVQGAEGWIQGALADLPSSIVKGAYGTGKTISGLLQGDPETYKGMYQGTKDLANQVIDTTIHAGGRPQQFGRMMGQMTGQPLVTEGIMRGGAINPARFEAPIPRSTGALPESTLPIIDIPPTMEGLPEGLHAQNQLARIGTPESVIEPIPTQFEPANIEPIPTEFQEPTLSPISELRQQNILELPQGGPDDAGLINDTFDQMNTSPEQMQAPQQKTEAIQAAQNQMGQATQESIPVDPEVQRAAEFEHLNSTQDRQELYDLFGRWVDEHRRIRESGGMGTPEQQHANRMFNTANQRIQAGIGTSRGLTTPNPPPEPFQTPEPAPQTETIPGGEASADDRNVDVQEINNATPDRLIDLGDEWHRRWRDAHNRGDTALANYASRMSDLAADRIDSAPVSDVMPESDTPTESDLQTQGDEWEALPDDLEPSAEDRAESERLRNQFFPHGVPTGGEPVNESTAGSETVPSGRQLSRGQRADVRSIRNATTSTRLNELYRQWNEEYQDARRYNDEPGMAHAREMAELIDNRLTDEFNNVPGQPPATPTTHPVDLGQAYHVYDSQDGSVIATFNTRYQARNFIDEDPSREHLDFAPRGEIPSPTGVRKKTLTELREATGVPNPPITFGKQDLSIITDLTDAQIARLRGGAGRDERIDVKGRKPKADRKVEDAGYDAMAKRALAATPTGDPGLTIEDQSYGGTHKRYQIIFRGADGKAQALATVEENPDGWRQVPWLMADRTKGGKPAMYVMSAIAKMNATEQSGSISNHTANVIAQLTQRSDKLTARAGRKAARLKREGSTETPPPPED